MVKIIGVTVGTTMKRPDFKQTDPKKSDYIKNNPIPAVTENDEGKIVRVVGGKYTLEPTLSEEDIATLEASMDTKIAEAITTTLNTEV